MNTVLVLVMFCLALISASIALIVWRALALAEHLDAVDRPPPPEPPPENPIDSARRALILQAQRLESAAVSLDLQGSSIHARDRWTEAREIREKLLRS